MKCLLIAAVLAFSVAGAAETVPNGKLLQVNLDRTLKLIEDSSAAILVDESNDKWAKVLKDSARQRYDKAVIAHKEGNYDAVKPLLSEAVSLMLKAVAATKNTERKDDKSYHDFENRRASVDALLAAHKRISNEKNMLAAHDALREEVEKEVAVAEALVNSGQIDMGRVHLDTAYDSLRLGIKALRGGDTLIRSLEFDSDEDEYEYELDRNDTHLMLVQVLVAERLEDESIREKVTPMLQEAARIRTEAEAQAGEGDFRRAVESLELSTRELVRAIRSAGIYIPS